MNKFKLNSLFGFLGVALLAISLPLTIYMLRTNNLDFRISAFESEEPQQVVISDVSSKSFRVSWITQKPVFGSLKLASSLQTVVDTEITSYHSLEVNNLKPGTDYSIQVLSGATVYETIYKVRTAASSPISPNQWLIGQVFSKDGTKTQKGGVLSLQLKVNGIQSQLLTALINETGGYQMNIGALLTSDLQKPFPWEQKVDVTMNMYTEFDEEPVVKTFTIDLAHEIQIPNIYLGDVSINTIPGIPGN